MADLEWHEVKTAVRPYVARILTPYGSGTGFVLSHSEDGDVYGIATAAHVVAQAHDWEMPIRIEHLSSGTQQFLRADKRAIFIDGKLDSAVIVFQRDKIELPKNPPPLLQEGKIIKVGVEIAWLGFPAVSPQTLCFFSGRVSAHLDDESGYLVDGVAINGVSGGPTLRLAHKTFEYIGIVSAYIANRATGDTLPGLAVVRDVAQFYGIVKQFKSVDEAKKQESPPQPKGPTPEPKAVEAPKPDAP